MNKKFFRWLVYLLLALITGILSFGEARIYKSQIKSRPKAETSVRDKKSAPKKKSGKKSSRSKKSQKKIPSQQKKN